MYLEEDLRKYDFFSKVLDNNKFEYITDSLTGLVNRKYMLEFAKSLINEKKPFTLAMLDLDDFKNINDKYGHSVGDYILENLGNDLIKYIGNRGLAGRFGGDEILMVLFDLNDYDKLHEFYCGMIHHETVLRKYFVHNDVSVFITGTIGSASYPENAQNFDDLFLMADKTLYRGKSKGRNCFIIYVHEKHKNLEIQKIHRDDLAIIIANINNIFDTNEVLEQKLLDTAEYLKPHLNLDKILYIDYEDSVYDLDDMKLLSTKGDISYIKFNNELHKEDYRNRVAELSFGMDIIDFGISSLLITRIKINKKVLGYIMFGLQRTAKIWQDDEITILMFLAKTIALEISSRNVLID